MARYFAGNSAAAFSRNSSACVEVTTAGFFDATYVSSCLRWGTLGGDNWVATFETTATGTVWIRFDARYQSVATNSVFATAYNASTAFFRLNPTSGTLVQAQYWNGSAWTNTGSTFAPPTGSLNTWAIKVDLNSGFELYITNTLYASGSGWTGSQTAMTALWFASPNASANNGLSQVMAADYDIRDSKFMVAALNGNSAANTGGTGAYTQVNETPLDDSTALTVTTVGNKQGQTHAAITIPAGYIIAAAVVAGRGRVSGTITDGKLGLRGSGGTNSSGTGRAYGGAYEPRLRIVDSDPDTTSNFTQAGFNAAEIYEEAA